MKAFTNLGEGNSYYLLSGNLLGLFNITTKNFSSWSLSSPDPCEGLETCTEPWWKGRWSGQEVLENAVQQRSSDANFPLAFTTATEWAVDDTLGCMEKNPLRYGDVDSDGVKELAVILSNSFVLFSTTLHKTIFAVMWDVPDWLSREKTVNEVYEVTNKPDYPQYASAMMYSTNNGISNAYRGYAKLYFGDFNRDGVFDIVVWRKLYESRLQNDPVSGFLFKGNTFVHYSLIDGSYKKQKTKPEDVTGWLNMAQLTWQKGYPSKSECPGQEGQLIPEMHDPLLNDPEVLQ